MIESLVLFYVIGGVAGWAYAIKDLTAKR